MYPVAFMAFADVRPVQYKHATVGARQQFDPTKPWVLSFEIIRTMSGDVAIAVALNDFAIDSAAVKVGG